MATLSNPVPVLRIFDEDKAREFYLGFLGFALDWEHRFGDDFPIYMQVSRDACTIQLSEHHGDATPGALLQIETADIDAFATALQAKEYKYAKPGDPEEQPWGVREVKITDPFGNRLNFFTPIV